MDKAIILLSGGMDSAVALAKAINNGFDIAALHLNYGQRTQKRELQAFSDLCNYYSIQEKLVVDIEYLNQIGGTSLIDKSIPIPKNTISQNKNDNLKNNINSINKIPSTYVPFRNGNILAIATSWAEIINANAIYIGANTIDSSGYPDTTAEFLSAFELAANLGTKFGLSGERKLKIYSPLINFSKKDIVLHGIELGVPFELTWSCYEDNEIACGECESCLLRLRGFREAGAIDPIPYK
ncbi:MAG TPA: 7-cyano-7-deazaguanine synthase QueC [Bacteroidota bacterium]|nr:7-cyano-7-deazaguanine synthase QueC [Candidatus Kapabacteria bacterium]HRS01390.1 7-cyano-7-deazaguanine synthase QueC [Bacteroidota bacterium]HRT67944.1 7-cyano-7-deazaguanine synthase QueC [Bacteroidota bacterium]